MKRGRMPFHGRLALIHMKRRRNANVLVIGDTATGKSETLEALRLLAGDAIRGITIIADDMGSLGIGRTGGSWATERRSAPSSGSTTCSGDTPSARSTAPSS